MFRYLQSRIRGTASPGPGAPPPGLLAFYWHFARQTKGWYALMFATSLAVALIDTVIPVFIGRLVSLMEAVDRQAALDREWPLLAGMVALVLLVRPLVMLADVAIRHNAIIPGATSMIRWQSHWHVVRQSWPFFQNDFAGRIANRVMQTANALRESVMAGIRAVWRDPDRVQEWAGELSKSDPVVVFCVYGFHVGCRTAIALRDAGFDAKYMKGGHSGWKAIGGPTRMHS